MANRVSSVILRGLAVISDTSLIGCCATVSKVDIAQCKLPRNNDNIQGSARFKMSLSLASMYFAWRISLPNSEGTPAYFVTRVWTG